MSEHDVRPRAGREAAEAVAASRGLPYAALLVSSVVLGFQVFR